MHHFGTLFVMHIRAFCQSIYDICIRGISTATLRTHEFRKLRLVGVGSDRQGIFPVERIRLGGNKW